MSSFDSPGFIEHEINQNEPLEIRRKRLKFRSWHRGIKEADILLGHFADNHLAEMGKEQLDHYEDLLREPDLKIVAWVTKDAPAPEHLQNDVMEMLQALDYIKIVK